MPAQQFSVHWLGLARLHRRLHHGGNWDKMCQTKVAHDRAFKAYKKAYQKLCRICTLHEMVLLGNWDELCQSKVARDKAFKAYLQSLPKIV